MRCDGAHSKKNNGAIMKDYTYCNLTGYTQIKCKLNFPELQSQETENSRKEIPAKSVRQSKVMSERQEQNQFVRFPS